MELLESEKIELSKIKNIQRIKKDLIAELNKIVNLDNVNIYDQKGMEEENIKDTFGLI